MTELVALGVQTPQINTVGNFLSSRQAAREDVSTQINQQSANMAQEAAALEQIATMGLGVMGGKVDGEVDPKAFGEMLDMLGSNPLAEKLRANPELLPMITRGSMKVLEASQSAEEFELRKKQFDLEMQKFQESMKPGMPDAPKVERIFDPASGRDKMVQWNPDTQSWVDLGGVEAPSDANGITITNADGSTTQIGGAATKAPIAYDVEDAKRLVKLGGEIADAGRNGTQTVSTLAKMKELLGNDDVYTGIGAEGVAALQRAGKVLGIESGIQDTETFNALSRQAALDVMGGSLGTGFSNADRQFVIEQVPNLGNTKPGNLQLIEIQTKIAERKVAIAKFAAEYKKAHSGRLDASFEDALAEWAEANPLFPDAGSGGDDPAALSDMPKVGDVMDGYEFTGGDPAVKDNWKKVN